MAGRKMPRQSWQPQPVDFLYNRLWFGMVFDQELPIMFHRTLPQFCLAFALLATGNGFAVHPAGTVAQEPALTDANFGNWQERLKAKESELVWQNLPWLTSFHEGLMQAAKEDKPLLLWVMNGHPLGCT